MNLQKDVSQERYNSIDCDKIVSALKQKGIFSENKLKFSIRSFSKVKQSGETQTNDETGLRQFPDKVWMLSHNPVFFL